MLEKANFAHFVNHPLGEKNYPKASFDKSRTFNKQEIDKMKKICSNQVLEPTLSNHLLEIYIDTIEKRASKARGGKPARLTKRIYTTFW